MTEQQKIKHREYMRAWSKANRMKINKYRKLSPFRKDQRQKEWRAHRLANPKKNRARVAVYLAIRRGKLVRPATCERCLKNCRPEAHHHNGYAAKLDVQWLCRPCHRKAD